MAIGTHYDVYVFISPIFFAENVADFYETGMLFWTHFQLETKAWLDKNLKETANYKTAYQLIA